MRLPVTDPKFLTRPVSRTRLQDAVTDIAVLRSDAGTRSRYERKHHNPTPDESDLSHGLHHSERQRLRAQAQEYAENPLPSAKSATATLAAVRAEGKRHPEQLLSVATAFLSRTASAHLFAL
jgi:hypothetical protein